jgi:hypothetical protein
VTEVDSRSLTRRGFIRAAGTVALGAGLTACSTPPAVTPSASPFAADLRLVDLAASMERALVDAYTAALAAAQPGGRLAPAPAAFLALTGQARAQHEDHAVAWNATLTANHMDVARRANTVLSARAAQQLGAAQSVSDLAAAMLQLEQAVLETYVAVATRFSDGGTRRLAMQIAPVEAQHAAVLSYLLGAEPVGAATVGTSAALALSRPAG